MIMAKTEVRYRNMVFPFDIRFQVRHNANPIGMTDFLKQAARLKSMLVQFKFHFTEPN
jgi:hypothetical protein